MNFLKVFAAVWTIAAALLCLLLIWNENSVTCSLETCKVCETLFLFVALVGYSTYKDIKVNNDMKS